MFKSYKHYCGNDISECECEDIIKSIIHNLVNVPTHADFKRFKEMCGMFNESELGEIFIEEIAEKVSRKSSA